MGYLASWWKLNWESVFIILVPIIYGIIPMTIDHVAARCGYVILIVATFWMTEVLPLPVTAVIPVFAFPLLGVLSTSDICIVYMKESNMMFIGGLAVAIAIEHCNLHQRIALFVILKLGQSPRRLMSSFMMTTMFLSMWISNTASTAMMIPVVEAIILELQLSKNKYDGHDLTTVDVCDVVPNDDKNEDAQGKDTPLLGRKIIEKDPKKAYKNREKELELESGKPVQLDQAHKALQDMCFMATAYSANIGGTGSLTGTGPNMVLKEMLDSSFSEPSGLNFATWMFFNVPGMIICVFLAWIWLQIVYMGLCRKGSTIQKSSPESEAAIKRLIQTRYHNLGPIKQQEITIFGLFITLVILWFFRAPGFMTGWADLISRSFGNKVTIGGATPAFLVMFLLFVLPKKWKSPCSTDPENNQPRSPSPACITWDIIQSKMPWNLMLLIGGGYALAKGATKSGLSEWLGLQLVGLQVMPKEAIVFVVSIMITMGTEVASNTATASILLPVLREMAMKMGVNPLYLMLPAAVCCSYAFMLPVATPPNAIAFNAGKMKSTDMMKAGFVMNIICVLVITVMINTIGVAMFDLHNMPAWTNSTIIE